MTDLLSEPLLTADDLAEFLAIPRDSVYQLPIPRLRVGRNRVRFRRADVERYLAGKPPRADADPAVRQLVDQLEAVVELTLRDVLDERDAERVFSVLAGAWVAVLEGADPSD